MSVKLVKKTDKSKLKRLYHKAFPKQEQKPFDLLLEKEQQGHADLFHIEKDGDFCGLAMFLYHGENVLLDYFAIDERLRGQNLGSQALQVIMDEFEEQNLFLEIESTEVESEDKHIRKKREKFYLRNGIKHLGITVKLREMEMMLMGNHKKISFEEYKDLYSRVLSKDYAKKNVQLVV